MKIGERIKSKRIELGYTLEEVANFLKITRQTVQKYESGVVTNIPSDKIEALATLLKTTPSYLMGWEENLDEDTPPEIRVIERAGKKMNAGDREKMLKMLQIAFEDAFKDMD